MSLPMDVPFCDACRRGLSPTAKHTCWRRAYSSQSDDEGPPAKKQLTTDNQPHRSGSVNDGGYQFEMKMVAVIGLRGLNGLQRNEDFELFSNRQNAGNFDDIVYTIGGRRYFIQLKHTDSPDKNKLTEEYLVELLQKCFKSYCNIKYGVTFKDIPFNSSDFIIYTNKELEPTLLTHEEIQRENSIFFKTSEEGKIFSFLPDKNRQNDIYTLLENEMRKSKEFRNSSNREKVSEFLNKLIIATGQKGQWELDEVIDEEIRKRDAVTVDDEVYQTELLEFKTRVEIWCRNKKEEMTATMFRNWLQEAKTKACAPVVRTLIMNCTKKLVDTGMCFSDSEVSRLQAKLFNSRAVHLWSDALTLCSILLLDCLNTSGFIFVTFKSLQSNKNMLLHAWLGGHWEWLIVFCDSTVQQSDISGLCRKISEIIKLEPSNKQVVILTACKAPIVSDFVTIGHEFKFEQLSKESQEIVLDKTIDFQGCEVRMRNLLQQHGNVEHGLGPELVTDLVTEGTTVNIGGRLQANEGYYAPRELEMYIWLHPNVLQNSNDIFLVSGTTSVDLCKIVPSFNTMWNFLEEEDMRGNIFLLPDEYVESFFPEIRGKYPDKTVNFVEFRKGDLLWVKSIGEIESLLDYIDADKTGADKRIITEWMKSGSSKVNEDSIWDLNERTVLVVAEPGMGKSSTTTQVAWNKKQRDPTSWVVRINWNDHTRKLQEITAETFNFDSLVEFLCSTAFPESKYTDIERILLKQALQNSGNITVLMDGFDEISPTHSDKADVIISELMKTKVPRVWVTSRPVKKKRLENKLSVLSFSMKGLSVQSQVELLRNLWNYKEEEEEKIEERLEDFLYHINFSVHDENFTGCPLYILMIATVHEMKKVMYLTSLDSPLPRIDLVNMYQEFVERKLDIYLNEKQKADETNSFRQDDKECLKETYLKNFEKCALVAILPPSILELLHNKKIEEKIQRVLSRIQAGKDKTGIVITVMDGKPQFVHRTFAEFFTARWFSRNFDKNRSVLEHILFDDTYRVIKDMFDLMLAEDCPLHCAALQGNYGAVLEMLSQECDLNAEDKGGRNFMHAIAAGHWTAEIYDINYKASLHKTDSVLQWTPLQYATKLEKWFIWEWYRENNVDTSDLDMIRRRAQDTSTLTQS